MDGRSEPVPTQRDRTYAAEDECDAFHQPISIDEAMRLVKLARQKLGIPELRAEIHPGKKPDWGGEYRKGKFLGFVKGRWPPEELWTNEPTIHIFGGGLCAGTVAHEIAHHLSPAWEHNSHGPDFRGQCVRVVRTLWPWTAWADELEAAFRNAGLGVAGAN